MHVEGRRVDVVEGHETTLNTGSELVLSHRNMGDVHPKDTNTFKVTPHHECVSKSDFLHLDV